MGAFNKLKPLPLMSFDVSTFTGSYQIIGSGLSQPVVLIKFINDSNRDVTISWDGSTDHDFLPANSVAVLDVNTNRQQVSNLANIAADTAFFVKGSAAGSGNFYIVSFYLE